MPLLRAIVSGYRALRPDADDPGDGLLANSWCCTYQICFTIQICFAIGRAEAAQRSLPMRTGTTDLRCVMVVRSRYRRLSGPGLDRPTSIPFEPCRIAITKETNRRSTAVHGLLPYPGRRGAIAKSRAYGRRDAPRKSLRRPSAVHLHSQWPQR